MKKFFKFILFVILSGIVIFVSLNIHNSLKSKKELREGYNFSGTYEIMDFKEKYGLPSILQIIAYEDMNDYDEKMLKSADDCCCYTIDTSEIRYERLRDDEIPYTCYLCRIKSYTELVLLDENNGQVGTVTVSLGEADWLGRRHLEYTLNYNGEQKNLKKLSKDACIRVGSILKSKYYTGKIE